MPDQASVAAPRLVLKPVLKTLWAMVLETYDGWSRHNASTLAAALAYYTAFSIAPVLVLLIAIVGFVAGRAAVQNEAMRQVHSIMGPQASEVIQVLLQSAAQPGASFFATVIGIFTILISATGVFIELQRSLDLIWDVPPPENQGVWHTLRERMGAFVMVLGVGLVLFISLAASAVLTAAHHFFERTIGNAWVLFSFLNIGLSFAFVTLGFAMTYKLLPRTNVQWKDVWVGAVVTSLLFALGKWLLGWYFAKSAMTSSYGAAGSFAALLAWVYYSSQILFFGAEFTRVYASRMGSQQSLSTRQSA